MKGDHIATEAEQTLRSRFAGSAAIHNLRISQRRQLMPTRHTGVSEENNPESSRGGRAETPIRILENTSPSGIEPERLEL
jgi:hypothetical protein